jgi:SAM-dependent methyltransferase
VDVDAVETNRRNWDSRVAGHVNSELYNIEGFIRDRVPRIHSIERHEVGDVRGKSLLHLQCHIGTDTLSWALLGAQVTGVDFSAPALEQAASLADKMGLTATFEQADVQHADLGRTFDIVFASAGVFCWIEDIGAWMRTAKRHLVEGGSLYVFDSHPATWCIDYDSPTFRLADGWSYFASDPLVEQSEFSYAGDDRLTSPKTVEWNHTIGDVIGAALSAGLELEFLHEHPVDFYPRFTYYERDGDYWRIPGDPLPLTFSLKARG